MTGSQFGLPDGQFWYNPDDPDSTLQFSFEAGNHVLISVDSPRVVMKAPANWFGRDTVEIKVSDGELADSALVPVSEASRWVMG